MDYTGNFNFNDYYLYHGLVLGMDKVKHGRRVRHRLPIIATYAIINTKNGKAYVGSSGEVMGRWRNHFNALKMGKHSNTLLQNAYDKDGDHFCFVIIETPKTTDNLVYREEIAGSLFRKEDLYNYRLGHTYINGWNARNTTGGKQGYRPSKRHAPNSISRWYDHTGVRYLGVEL